jgi:hypothetical protein
LAAETSYDYRSDPVLGQVLDYWDSRRAGRAMPTRRDIDPIEIRQALPHLQIIELVDGGARFRYRLVGTALVTAFGKEYTGKFLDELFSGERLAFAQMVYRTVCVTKQPVFLRNRYNTTKDVGMVANRLYLPLGTDEGGVNFILGSLTFEYERGAHEGMWGVATLDHSAKSIQLVALAG